MPVTLANDPLAPRVRKMFTLALDPGATDGEATAAVAGVVRIARSRRWGLKELHEVLGTAPQVAVIDQAVPVPKPWGWHTTLRFGKFKTWTIGQVAESEPSYLEWCLENMESLDRATASAMRSVLDWVFGQGEHQ